MRVSFRQGIVRCKVSPSSGGPSPTPTVLFIQPNGSGTSVDLIATLQDATVMTFAHYGANYVAEETRSVVSAWGSGNVVLPGAATDVYNLPLTVAGNQYLYWDLDLGTGALRRGWTALLPIASSIAPVNPADDQHWFDLTLTRMRVWRQTPSGGHWLDKIRVFAGIYTSLGTIAPFTSSVTGSQVGITGQFTAGNILLGSNNTPLRQSDGTFVSTESQLIVQQTSGQNIKFDMALVYAQAAEDIPKFSLVSFNTDRRIALASSLNRQTFVSGLVCVDLYQNDVGQIATNGAIRNDQWNWDPSMINKPLFCGPTGEVTLTPPFVGVSQQIGFVYDVHSIYLNLFPPVRL